MPLNTQILRDGEPLDLRWSDFHVAAMVCAVAYDSGEGPFVDNTPEQDGYPDTPQPINAKNCWDLCNYLVIAMTPFQRQSRYTLQGTHRFADNTGCELGVLELLPGDELVMYRN